MPNFCAVVGCGNNGDKHPEKSFFRLPAVLSKGDENTRALCARRRQAFINALKRADLEGKKLEYFRICSDHFISVSQVSKTYLKNALVCAIARQLVMEVMSPANVICFQGRPADILDCNNPDWIPTLKTGYNRNRNPDCAMGRYERSRKRKCAIQDHGKVTSNPGSSDGAGNF